MCRVILFVRRRVKIHDYLSGIAQVTGSADENLSC